MIWWIVMLSQIVITMKWDTNVPVLVNRCGSELIMPHLLKNMLIIVILSSLRSLLISRKIIWVLLIWRKHSCNMTEDPFGYIRRELGRNSTISIPMRTGWLVWMIHKKEKYLRHQMIMRNQQSVFGSGMSLVCGHWVYEITLE